MRKILLQVRTIFIATFLLSGSSYAQVSYLFEGFENVTNNSQTPVPGWAANNLTNPVGPIGWTGGTPSYFTAFQGNDYIATNFENAAADRSATISNWLFSPVLNLQNGYIVKFYARDISNPNDYPDRLQFRMSTSGNSVDVGTTATSVGVFSTLLLDINPTYSKTAFPAVWTEYSITLSGLPIGITTGRVAFRYFVEDGGSAGNNGNFIGIDNFLYSSDGLLPVNFTSFTSLVSTENVVSLLWKTSIEQNNAYFAVERSLDGIHFAEIERVGAKKNIDPSFQYRFEDISAKKLKGITKLYYRLRQTDLDGKFTYSPIVKASLYRESTLSFVNINVTGSRLTARFNVPGGAKVDALLLNGAGQLIAKTSQMVVEGLNTIHFDSPGLLKGVYYIRLTDGKTVITGKSIK